MRVTYDFVEAPMPGIIEGFSDDKFQKLDYQIAASTFLFNKNKSEGNVPLKFRETIVIDTSIYRHRFKKLVYQRFWRCLLL